MFGVASAGVSVAGETIGAVMAGTPANGNSAAQVGSGAAVGLVVEAEASVVALHAETVAGSVSVGVVVEAGTLVAVRRTRDFTRVNASHNPSGSSLVLGHPNQYSIPETRCRCWNGSVTNFAQSVFRFDRSCETSLVVSSPQSTSP